jgi:ribulose-bisphosphate carboxylase large chain
MNRPGRIAATWQVRAPRDQIEPIAQGIAIEQSVEVPLAAITDPRVLDQVVGRVHAIRQIDVDLHEVVIDLAIETLGGDVAQSMNMLLGNTSLHAHAQLVDVDFPPDVIEAFPRPRFGVGGLRALTGVQGRALTCAALKPQGMGVEALARLCGTFAQGGVDVIKDDHGLADQRSAPFAERVRACQAAVAAANAASGSRAIYVPSLVGSPGRLIEQARIAREAGCAMVMLAPALIGLPAFAEMVAYHLGMPVLAHPSMAGAARVAPELLFGKLYRLLGADATIFVNHGGRFGYSRATSIAIADASRRDWPGVKACLPVPAGGMTVERVPEMLADYGEDVMLLIGGSLLVARDALLERTRAFTRLAGA